MRATNVSKKLVKGFPHKRFLVDSLDSEAGKLSKAYTNIVAWWWCLCTFT